MLHHNVQGWVLFFFDETVDRIEPGGSLSNADFEAEFDVDYPYVPEHEYALDIELFFEE